MAYVVSDEILAQLEEMGIAPNDTRRMIIDLREGQVPVIHIEQYGDRRVLNLVKAVCGAEVEVREIDEDSEAAS